MVNYLLSTRGESMTICLISCLIVQVSNSTFCFMHFFMNTFTFLLCLPANVAHYAHITVESYWLWWRNNFPAHHWLDNNMETQITWGHHSCCNEMCTWANEDQNVGAKKTIEARGKHHSRKQKGVKTALRCPLIAGHLWGMESFSFPKGKGLHILSSTGTL